MIDLKSKRTIDSTAVPGVKFTVRVLNRIARARRDLGMIDAGRRIAEIVSEYADLSKQKELTPEQDARKRALDMEYTLLRDSEIYPATIRAGLISLEALQIDGEPATVETLLSDAGADYDDLISEIYAACDAAAGLSTAETKNSPSPTIGTAPEDINSPTFDAQPVVG